jgi:hypothetical protein
MRSGVFLLSMQFFSFVWASLIPLGCETFDVSRMTSAPYMECSVWMQAIGSIAFVGYGLFGPLTIGLLARRCLTSPIFAQLHATFRGPTKYWEFVLVLRRILFLIVSVEIPLTSSFRPLGQCLVLMTSAVFHVMARPFGSSEANVSEMVSLGLLVLNLMAAVCARAGIGGGRAGILHSSLITFILDSLFVIYLVVRVTWQFFVPRSLKNYLRWPLRCLLSRKKTDREVEPLL